MLSDISFLNTNQLSNRSCLYLTPKNFSWEGRNTTPESPPPKAEPQKKRIYCYTPAPAGSQESSNSLSNLFSARALLL